jgi:hypothetical protein
LNKIHIATALGASVCALTISSSVLAADPARATKSLTPVMPAPTGEAAPVEKPHTDELAPNSIYLEGLGAGLAYSLNYERMIVDDFAVRVGFGYLSIGASATSASGSASASASFLSVPLIASYTGVRSGKHALELGAGTTLIFASASASGFGMNSSGSGMAPLGDLLVGYRIHPVNGAGFNFRIGAMALIGQGLSFSSGNADSLGVLPWFYLSLGASF